MRNMSIEESLLALLNVIVKHADQYATAPSIIGALILCYTDVRSRRVPRVCVVTSFALQSMVTMVYAWLISQPLLLINGLILSAISMLICLLIYCIAPSHSIGFGDATCTIMLSQAFGICGIQSYGIWIEWISIITLIWLGLWVSIRAVLQHGHTRVVQQARSTPHVSSTTPTQAHNVNARSTLHTNIPLIPPLTTAAIIAIVFS